MEEKGLGNGGEGVGLICRRRWRCAGAGWGTAARGEVGEEAPPVAGMTTRAHGRARKGRRGQRGGAAGGGDDYQSARPGTQGPARTEVEVQNGQGGGNHVACELSANSSRRGGRPRERQRLGEEAWWAMEAVTGGRQR